MTTKLWSTWRRVRNVPGLLGNLVAVGVIFLIGAVALAYLLPHFDIDSPWDEKFEFSALVEEAPGMVATAKHKVNIAGIEVGTVRGLEATSDGTAKLTMSIGSVFTVYRNARLQVRSQAPINDIIVELDQGTADSGALPAGSTIPLTQTSRFVSPDEVFGKLDQRTQSAVTELMGQADLALRQSPRDLPVGLAATGRTLDTLRPVMELLQTRRARIQELVTELTDISQAAGGDDRRLASLIARLQETAGVLDQRQDELGRTVSQLPELTGSLRRAMADTGELTTKLNPTLDALHEVSGELPATLKKLTEVVEQADPLVKRAIPVVRKARPVVDDLRPVVDDVRGALDDLEPTTALLPCATGRLAPWMPNLAAFVYHTSSAFSLADANGGLGRANLNFDVTNPTGGLASEPGTTGPGYGQEAFRCSGKK